MLVARLQQGLLRLRSILPKFKMADIPKESVAAGAVPESAEVVSMGAASSNKRSLTSDGADHGDAKALVAGRSEPSVKKLKTEQEEQKPNLTKLVKRKVAMLLAYSGVGYKGMQKNPGEKTIEEDLINALVKCQAIPEEHGQFLGKMAFQRCARTDKGVSAAGQVVSLKMLLLNDIVEKINENLPSCIRVFGVKRTTASFNSKHNCDFRTYMYMLPTFAFEPIEQFTTESYRIDDEKIREVKDLLELYVGTHNFHNFTSGKPFRDPSANRFIREFVCDKPFMYGGLEFVILRVKGQSFMLHQIRKMIGLVIAIAKGFTPQKTLPRAFEADKLDIPRAPGLGLVLESIHYEAYNRKWGRDGMHQPLEWDESQDELEAFKREQIYPTILNTEKTQRSMMQWLSTLTLHTYDVIDGTPNPYRQTARELYQNKKDEKKRQSSSTTAPDGNEVSPLVTNPPSHHSTTGTDDGQSSSTATPNNNAVSHSTAGTDAGGPEVSSTTTQDHSNQDGGLEGTLSVGGSHKTETTSEVETRQESNETEKGNINNTNEAITRTCENLDAQSEKT